MGNGNIYHDFNSLLRSKIAFGFLRQAVEMWKTGIIENSVFYNSAAFAILSLSICCVHCGVLWLILRNILENGTVRAFEDR